MSVQFFLFGMAILLALIFWELSKVSSCLKTLLTKKKRITNERRKTPQDIRKQPKLNNREGSRIV
jgi:hypothetical protein